MLKFPFLSQKSNMIWTLFSIRSDPTRLISRLHPDVIYVVEFHLKEEITDEYLLMFTHVSVHLIFVHHVITLLLWLLLLLFFCTSKRENYFQNCFCCDKEIKILNECLVLKICILKTAFAQRIQIQKKIAWW